MKREDFTGLPPSVALGWLWDVLSQESRELSERFAEALVPKVPMSPKYDMPIYRREGLQWASETDAEGLRYWQQRYSESSDPKYAEKDAKRAKNLGFWLAWRTVEPYAAWTGERNHETVTANPPSKKPKLHDRNAPSDRPKRNAPPKFADEREEESAFDDDNDIPF